MKQAFLLSEQGVINIYFFRDQRPRIQWVIDLGIPNFTVFALELPIPEDNPGHTQIVFHEGTALLLDQIKAFLVQSEFKSDGGVIRSIIQAIKKTEFDFNSTEPMIGYEILFNLTPEFFRLVMNRLVKQKMGSKEMDAAAAVWKGQPLGGRYIPKHEGEMVKRKDQKALDDAKKIIDRYKQTLYKNTPGPMYVLLYDRYGKPRGVSRVTNKGLTKWAGAEKWGAWWLLPDGSVLPVADNLEHYEAARQYLKLDKGMWDTLDTVFGLGWIRVSYEAPEMYFEVRGRWTREQLYLAQSFASSVGGVKNIIVEEGPDSAISGKMQTAELPLGDFLVLNNPSKVWRQGLTRSALLQKKSVDVPPPTYIKGPPAWVSRVVQQERPDAAWWYNKLNGVQLERENGLPKGVLKHLIEKESKGNPLAKSPRGAKGLFQIMPKRFSGFDGNPLDPHASAQFAAKTLKQLLNRFGTINKALAAYNWGPANLNTYGIEQAPKETRNFVQFFQDKGIG